MKNNILTITVMCLFLSGCGWFDREVAKLTGHSKHCVGNVLYIQFASGATVAYNPDGSIKTCKLKG